MEITFCIGFCYSELHDCDTKYSRSDQGFYLPIIAMEHFDILSHFQVRIQAHEKILLLIENVNHFDVLHIIRVYQIFIPTIK